ncbi:MAG: hypothetical protein A4S09_15335 [Proteobacteria bacterium SG_bin7]|nr:MAG: hypothetical protein A4S09_15335 [Proteobacteria bacterium SG_bin7]
MEKFVRSAKATKKTSQISFTSKTYEDVIADFNQCCLCGTDLNFTHKVDYENRTIQEEAFCPACSIKTKNNNHILQ